MSLRFLKEGRGPANNRLLWLADLTVRVLIVAIIPIFALILLHFSSKAAVPVTFQEILSDLAQGILPALVLLPLARRLPYRMPIRILSLFLPLYWTMYLGNFIEAAFYTTTPLSELIAGSILFLILSLITAWLMAWLFPAYIPEQPIVKIWQALSQRSLLSWVWRIVVVGLLYPIFLNYVFGALFSPIIGPYYHNPAYQNLSGTLSQPFYISLPEEAVRGIIFALTLLPALAVLRGRTQPTIFYTMLYLSLIGVVLEAVIGVAFSEPTWPTTLRIAETFNTGLDGIARGVIITLFLALSSTQQATDEARATNRTPTESVSTSQT